MNHPDRSLVPALALVTLACCAATAAAQGWSGAGAPVCTAAGAQGRVFTAADGAGGAYVGWSDARPGSAGSDVYVLRLGPDGQPAAGWPADGLAICTANGEQLLMDMTVDGGAPTAGGSGAYLVWEDYRAGAFADVYGQRVLADGTLPAGWPADGLGIAVFMEEQRDPKLVPDEAGGVFVVWADARTYSFSQRDVYAQHLLANGAPEAGWAANGMRVTNASTYDWQPRAAADPDGGLYVTWTRGLSGQDVGAQHLGPDGLPVATWPDTGIVLCGAPLDQAGPVVVSVPGGEALAVWKDQRNYTAQKTETGFYALRFGPDTSRAAGWPRDGMLLHSSTNNISAPFGVSDGAGGMLFGWGELVTGTDEDLFVMHADALGLIVVSIAFPDGIVPVCPDPSYQHPVAFVPDGAGGVYVGFDDYRDAGPSFTNPDAYVQHVTGGARLATGWPATGVALTKETTPETSTRPVAVAGGVVAAYLRGSGAASDVYASFVGLDGIVPALVSLVSSEATAERVRVTWQVAGETNAEWIVERRDGAAPWREIARALPDGTGRVSVTDATITPGARYGYRLAPAFGGAALGETWLDVPRGAAAFALRGVAPNPVSADARVRFALPEPGEAVLTLLDPQGRRVSEWRADGASGERELALTGFGRLAPGLYWLRLRQGAREASVRIAIVR